MARWAAGQWVVQDGRQPNGERVVERAVVNAVERKFFSSETEVRDVRKFTEVMEQLQWDGLNGCYFFMHAGMYHGVETDGHIHT